MEGKVIERPAIASERRVLGARRLHAAAPEAIEPVAIANSDPHAACRARERVLAEGIREELERELAAAALEERARARSEGFEEGRREAMELAIAESQAAEAKRTALAESLAESIRQAHQDFLDRSSEAAVEIGFAAACRVLGEALVTADGIRAAAMQVVARSHLNERVTVRLSSGDFLLLRESGGTVSDRMEFIPDAAQEAGGCIVEGSAGTLDGRLRVQMEALFRAIVEAHAAAATENMA